MELIMTENQYVILVLTICLIISGFALFEEFWDLQERLSNNLERKSLKKIDQEELKNKNKIINI
jgi:hypothetical protein